MPPTELLELTTLFYLQNPVLSAKAWLSQPKILALKTPFCCEFQKPISKAKNFDSLLSCYVSTMPALLEGSKS